MGEPAQKRLSASFQRFCPAQKVPKHEQTRPNLDTQPFRFLDYRQRSAVDSTA